MGAQARELCRNIYNSDSIVATRRGISIHYRRVSSARQATSRAHILSTVAGLRPGPSFRGRLPETGRLQGEERRARPLHLGGRRGILGTRKDGRLGQVLVRSKMKLRGRNDRGPSLKLFWHRLGPLNNSGALREKCLHLRVWPPLAIGIRRAKSWTTRPQAHRHKKRTKMGPRQGATMVTCQRAEQSKMHSWKALNSLQDKFPGLGKRERKQRRHSTNPVLKPSRKRSRKNNPKMPKTKPQHPSRAPKNVGSAESRSD